MCFMTIHTTHGSVSSYKLPLIRMRINAITAVHFVLLATSQGEHLTHNGAS